MFDGNRVYLYAFNTKIREETKDGHSPDPFTWAEAVAFKYDGSSNPGKKFYTNFNFAPSPSPENIIGTESNPLTVRTMEHIRNLEDTLLENQAKAIGGKAYLTITRDIDAEDAELYDGGSRYLSTLKSHVILDGGGNTITGLQAALVENLEGTIINLNVSKATVALNTYLTAVFVLNVKGGGVVENCTVTDSTISFEADYFQPGTFVGKNSGIIRNCSVTNIVQEDKRPSYATGPVPSISFYHQSGGTFINCTVRTVKDGKTDVIWSSNP
jgi:hypothetical protein